jgi:hypothetical protein
MGGGGMNVNQAGAMNQWQPGFNQSQLDYIQSQGKLPGALGGGALNPAQQNFFNVKGYLPKGFAGGDNLGQQYYRPQPQQQQQYNPYGSGYLGPPEQLGRPQPYPGWGATIVGGGGGQPKPYPGWGATIVGGGGGQPKPYPGWGATVVGGGGGQPQQGGFNQNQLNYIQSQGKLPGALGAGALNPAQQNFFNVKGYLPKGFAGGDNLGQQYYRPQQQPSSGLQPLPYGGTGGYPFGLGGGYPSQQQLAGSNKGPPAIPL